MAAPSSFADVFGPDLLFDMDGKSPSARLGFISRHHIRIGLVYFAMGKIGCRSASGKKCLPPGCSGLVVPRSSDRPVLCGRFNGIERSPTDCLSK